ncbi:MAG: hypothetical protein CVV04_09265 [Firmicutes bacterium HGW-Firmicutes-9]|jgi:hypothetical protein|nr:MAG: hypothetical protein CVV04_09265 [Firmicutes bacterium HGW-Firmicutes-9]
MIETFVCPKCKDVFSKETKKPLDGPACPTCNLPMHYMGITADTWQNLTHDEKASLKEKMLEDYKSPQTIYLSRMSNDIHTIRNVVIFFLVVFLCSGILRSIFASLN